MPTIRQVAALGCYIVASTLLVVTLRVGPDPGEPGAGVVQHMDAVPRAWPVLLVHDGQNTQKAGKLRKNWHAVETHATAYADLILAVRSAYFVGNPASSFSANVVMIRRALGASPTSSNLRVLDFPRPGSYK